MRTTSAGAVGAALLAASTTFAFAAETPRPFFSKEEVVCTPEMDLERAFPFMGWDNQRFFLAIHRSRDEFPWERLTIWRGVGSSYSLVEEIRSESSTSYFSEPTVFRYNGDLFLWVTERFYGTGAMHADTIFVIASDTSDLALRTIHITSAREWFAEKLRSDEGIWKGEYNSIRDDDLTFRFDIWRTGDGNCCPTGGSVSGAYIILKDAENGSYSLTVDTYTRGPVRNE